MAVLHFWWAWCTAAGGQVCVLAVVVLLADWFLTGRGWTGLRSTLWLLVLAKLVLPPTLTSPVSLARLLPDAGGAVPAVAAAAEPAGPGWPVALFALWSAGVVTLAGAGGIRLVRVRRRLLAGALPAAPEVREEAQRAAALLGLRTLPRVVVSAAVRTPCVLGGWRPFVVLDPALAAAPGTARLRHALLHELGHVRRGDPWWALVVAAVHCVWWFHPVAWLAARRLGLLRELGCDALVARLLGPERDAYRRTLLTTARPWIEGHPAAGHGLVHQHADLLQRLTALARPPSVRSRAQRLAAALGVLALLFCCVPLARPAAPRIPPLADLQGCLQVRYAVLAQLAASAPDSPVRGVTREPR